MMKLGRVAEISKVFIEEGLGFLTERKTPTPADGAEAEQPSDTELGVRLRRTLERLGPTFVKFGQLLGTRVDLFSEELVAELALLHSHVTPFPHDEARKIIAAELGAEIEDVFAEFPDEPTAAASIAQVYRARLKEPGLAGEARWVAIKVQRPGMEESLLQDLEVLVQVSGFIDLLVPAYRRSMVHRVAEEYAQRAKTEIDFLAEAQAIERFADVLATLPEFRAPAVYRDLSTPRLLVMEWLEGTKLDTVKTREALAALGFDPDEFGRSMLRLQLSMSYEHGFVHGDTHPGNIILAPSGQIGLIDFGLHGHVPRKLRDKMLEMLFYQSSGRIDEAVEAFITVFQPDPSLDLDAFRKELGAVLATPPGPSTAAENRATEQLIEGMRVGARYHLKAQSDLFMVIRNLTIIEGIVLRFSPGLDLVEEVRNVTGAIMRRRLFGPSMREEITQLLPHVLLTLSKRPQLAERLLRLERAFSDAKNLGEFLRREQVIRDPAPARAPGWLLLGLVGALGVAVGVAIMLALEVS
ncbi:MAG: AarF/ABC1/UbiB kinase family protein [Deltaproteobacteria bacterium]|nr:AarF/ABC1/UbiB kinase family protein [Deltaproteobacteria bacterium]